MAATDLYVPIDLAGRLVTAARNHLERQSRYLDPAAPPVELLDEWVAQLERARVSPSPIPEPGDVLVKQDRGEQWYLSRDGWRELAPVEWQRADADRLVDAPTEDVRSKGYSNVPGDARAGAGGVCGVHGVYDGVVCPGCRRADEARVTLAQDAADRAVEDLHGTVAAAGPPWPWFVQEVLDDLAERSAALHRAAEILLEDETVAERDLVDGIRAYADGLDRGRKALLHGATEAFR